MQKKPVLQDLKLLQQKLAVEFCKDKLYIQNVYVYAQLYPFDFTKPNVGKSNRNTTIELVLDTKFHKNLRQRVRY